jgi:hypothetical protein
MDGWRDGWMDGWRDGWMEGFILSRRPLLYVMFNDIIFEPTITINIKKKIICHSYMHKMWGLFKFIQDFNPQKLAPYYQQLHYQWSYCETSHMQLTH